MLDTILERPAELVEAERFEINSEENANWYLGKLHAIEAEKALVTAQCAAILSRLDTDKAALERQFQSGLEHFVRQQTEGGKRKSLALLYGTCAIRTVPRSVRVANEQEAIAWASSHRFEFVSVEMVATLDKNGYRKWAESVLNADGELLPGVEVTPERETFKVTFAQGEIE